MDRESGGKRTYWTLTPRDIFLREPDRQKPGGSRQRHNVRVSKLRDRHDGAPALARLWVMFDCSRKKKERKKKKEKKRLPRPIATGCPSRCPVW